MSKTKALAKLAAAAAMITVVSCAQNDSSTTQNGVDINNFNIEESIKSASQTFIAVDTNGDTTFLSLRTTIHWPEKLGENNISALQRQILATAFDGDSLSIHSLDINSAIANFVGNTSILADENNDGTDLTFEKVDSINITGETPSDFEAESEGRFLEISTDYVTYSVTLMSYLGGPHPNTASVPFTYDLAASKVVDYDDLFEPGSTKIVGQAIVGELAARNNVSPSRLTEIGFFSNTIAPSKMVYIANDCVMFHYNPYDIAPYAAGMIDVEVPPYELYGALTPYGRQLLGVGD